MQFVYLGIAIVAEVIATTSLRAANGFARPWPSLLTMAGYGVTFYFLRWPPFNVGSIDTEA